MTIKRQRFRRTRARDSLWTGGHLPSPLSPLELCWPPDVVERSSGTGMGSSPSSGVSLTGGLSFPEETIRSLSFWGHGHPGGGGHCDGSAGTAWASPWLGFIRVTGLSSRFSLGIRTCFPFYKIISLPHPKLRGHRCEKYMSPRDHHY